MPPPPSPRQCMDQEAPSVVPSNRPAADWPQAGRVSFSKVCLRYRPELPQVLRNITFDVHAREKIGQWTRREAWWW